MNYLQNYQSKKIKDFDKSELNKEILELITHVLKYTNRLNGIDIKFLAENLITDLNSFKNITLEEVKQAFRDGIRGEIIDISNTVLFKWIQAYLNNKERIDILYNNQLKNNLLTPKLSKEEIEEKNSNYILNTFNNFKNGINIHDYQGIIYDELILKNHELIDFNNFLDKAKQLRIEEEKRGKAITLTEEGQQKTIYKSPTALKEINIIVKNIEGNTDKLVIYKAKTLSLIEYFSNLDNLII